MPITGAQNDPLVNGEGGSPMLTAPSAIDRWRTRPRPATNRIRPISLVCSWTVQDH